MRRRTATACATTSWPPINACPPVGSTRVVRMPMVVVLPAPLGPSKPKNSPLGTAKSLYAAGVAVREVSDFTGAAEILDGRVKTLHPRVHGGILGRPTTKHREEMRQAGLSPIDLVVVNLYPFRETVARDAPFEEV